MKVGTCLFVPARCNETGAVAQNEAHCVTRKQRPESNQLIRELEQMAPGCGCDRKRDNEPLGSGSTVGLSTILG